MIETGLRDKNDAMIHDGDFVALGPIMTADDSLGDLPSGWFFDEDDIYQVYFDERIDNWSLKLGIEPDSRYNVKYMNHALSLLYGKEVEKVGGK